MSSGHGDHTELWDYIDGLRDDLAAAVKRIEALEATTPQAQQLQAEADQAVADLAASGYDRHGRDCDCSCCYLGGETIVDTAERTRSQS